MWRESLQLMRGGHPGPCPQQLPNSRSKHPFSLSGSLSLAMEWPNQESLHSASEYFAALPMRTANIRAENSRARASDRGYTQPGPSVLTRLPLHSSQVACEYSFFIPAGLVWHPQCWKNSQEDVWWVGFRWHFPLENIMGKSEALAVGKPKIFIS